MSNSDTSDSGTAEGGADLLLPDLPPGWDEPSLLVAGTQFRVSAKTVLRMATFGHAAELAALPALTDSLRWRLAPYLGREPLLVAVAQPETSHRHSVWVTHEGRGLQRSASSWYVAPAFTDLPLDTDLRDGSRWIEVTVLATSTWSGGVQLGFAASPLRECDTMLSGVNDSAQVLRQTKGWHVVIIESGRDVVYSVTSSGEQDRWKPLRAPQFVTTSQCRQGDTVRAVLTAGNAFELWVKGERCYSTSEGPPERPHLSPPPPLVYGYVGLFGCTHAVARLRTSGWD